MKKEQFEELYAELCNVVDKEMNKLSGFSVPKEIPSTSPQARECVDRILQTLAGYGIDLQPTE